MERKPKYTALLRTVLALLACAGTSLPAAALWEIQSCPQGYVAYATGVISYTAITNENYPHALGDDTAKASASERCYGMWTNPLAFANAGGQVVVTDLHNGYYSYTCLKCVGAPGPIKARRTPIDASTAVGLANVAQPGRLVSVSLDEYAVDAAADHYFYQVDIQQGDLIVRVDVDAVTGQVTVPPPIAPDLSGGQ